MVGSQASKQRWIAPLIALGLLALALAALFARLGDAPSGSRELVERCLLRLETARQLHAHAQGASVPLVQLLVAPDRDTRVLLYQRIDAANAAAEKALTELENLGSSPDERQRLGLLRAARSRYDERYTAAVEEIELTGGPQGALEQFWSGTRDALKELEMTTATLMDDETQRLAQERAALVAEESGQRWNLVLLAVALVLAAWAGAAVVKARRP